MAVIDANVAAGLVVDLPWSDQARHEMNVHDERIAPAVFAAELGNVVWQNVRSGSISAQTGFRAIDELLPMIDFVPDRELLHPALRFAIGHQHPIYDCLYLVLAMSRRQLLLTADMKLAALARRVGCPVKLLLQ